MNARVEILQALKYRRFFVFFNRVAIITVGFASFDFAFNKVKRDRK